MFLHVLANPEDFPVSFGIASAHYQQGNLANFASLGPLQQDPGQIKVGGC
jgi:hypothetical protein